ncbi:hypothetical protein [Shewanella phage SFCi1]|nr:hypothetical protein [Shewanella phage SFCi1]
MKNQRLVGRLELSRRLTRATKSTVYRQCEKGGRLHAAMVGTKINLDHKSAKIYCAEFGYQEPDIVAERASAAKAATAKAKAQGYDGTEPSHDTIGPDEVGDEVEAATDFMDMSLRDIVKTYGRQAQFKEYVSAYKILVQTQAAEEKMARDRKEYAHWSHLERLAMHIDGLHKLLMSDAAKNIAETVRTLSAAGASDAEVRKAVTRVHEQIISMAKANSDRLIRNAKS